MNAALVEQVANAVLYEGYILYPYRPTALKNRKRANFGVVPPRGQMRTECLFTGDDRAGIGVKVRFLHLADKDDWQEAVECVVSVPGCNVAGVVSQSVWEEFAFPLDGASRLMLSEKFKKIVANDSQTYHPKGRDAMTIAGSPE